MEIKETAITWGAPLQKATAAPSPIAAIDFGSSSSIRIAREAGDQSHGQMHPFRSGGNQLCSHLIMPDDRQLGSAHRLPARGDDSTLRRCTRGEQRPHE